MVDGNIRITDSIGSVTVGYNHHANATISRNTTSIIHFTGIKHFEHIHNLKNKRVYH